jgi:hypothetical protein
MMNKSLNLRDLCVLRGERSSSASSVVKGSERSSSAYSAVNGAPRRGLVLILVVAILVLLALMGTVYILSANLDKQTTYAYNAQANLQGATQNVLSVLSGVMLYNSTDCNAAAVSPVAVNTPLQIDPATPAATVARTWDFPEVGAAPTSTTNQGVFFQKFANGTSGQNVFTEPWLTADMPWEPNTQYYPGNTVFSSNSTTHAWGEYICTATSNSTTSPAAGNASWTALSVNANWPPLSVLTPYLYDTGTGAFDINYDWTGGPLTNNANITIPNASVVQPEGSGTTPSPYGTQDAIWNLLPSSDSNGTYYRYAVRVVDLNSRLNLNTGFVSGGTATADPYGEYLTSCPVFLSGVSGSSSDTPGNIQTNSGTTPGRQGTYGTAYALLDWQNELWYYEQQGKASNLDLMGLPDLLGLLAYGEYGCSTTNYNAVLGTNSFYSRPEQLLTNTLQYNTTNAPMYGNGYRDLYTTYSWDRNVAPVNTYNGETLNDFSGNTLYPRMVDLNAEVGTSSTRCASLAGEIEQAAVQCGYTKTEGTALALDYLQYRFNKGSTTSLTLNGTATNCYSVTPTLLTNAGSLYLPWNGASSTPWKGDAPTQYYVGQAPQPFINEFEIQVYNSGTTATPTYQVVGWGVELMNPYAVSLNLKNWGLYMSTTAATPQYTVATDISTITKNTGILAYSAASTTCLNEVIWTQSPHGSITAHGTNLSGAPSSSAIPATPVPTSVTIYLTRPCANAPADGVIAAGNVVVDQFTMTMPVPALNPPGSSSQYADAQRDNVHQVEWGCDSTPITLQSGASTDYGNLGLANTLAVTGNPGMPLYDRISVGYNSTATPFLSAATIDGPNEDLVNWDDFNCISRETTEVSTAGVSLPLSSQIGANTAEAFTGAVNFTNENYQADLYFDFAYDPRASFNAVTMGSNSTVQPTILSLMTLTDRASDPSITPTPAGQGLLANSTAGNPSPDLVRIPGRINLNTANGSVLYTAFSQIMNDGSLTVAKQQNLAESLAAYVITYRQRLTTATVPIYSGTAMVTPITTYNSTFTGFPVATYPGYGLHSLGDLVLASIPAETTIVGTPTTLQQRDSVWSDVANFCTVRSDTFAVYGYIQALQLNPNYNNGAVTSATDWYNANLYKTGGGENTIANTTATTNESEFILVGSERFVAILDRSQSNLDYPTLTIPLRAPRVVALQVMPQ